jgi:hypothetical protein
MASQMPVCRRVLDYKSAPTGIGPFFSGWIEHLFQFETNAGTFVV